MQELLRLPGVGQENRQSVAGRPIPRPRRCGLRHPLHRFPTGWAWPGQSRKRWAAAPRHSAAGGNRTLPPAGLHGRAVCLAESPNAAAPAPCGGAGVTSILRILLTFYTALFIIPLLVQNFGPSKEVSMVIFEKCQMRSRANQGTWNFIRTFMRWSPGRTRWFRWRKAPDHAENQQLFGSDHRSPGD